MKKLICAVLALTLIVGASAALAEPKKIDGISDRKIKIHKAGLNPSADEMIEQMISPTTGRRLDEIVPQDGFAGVAVTGTYQPIMVQISNSEGRLISDTRVRTRLMVEALAQEGDNVQSGSDRPGAGMGLEFYEQRKPEDSGREAAREALVALLKPLRA